jgi:hypothetical protein
MDNVSSNSYSVVSLLVLLLLPEQLLLRWHLVLITMEITMPLMVEDTVMVTTKLHSCSGSISTFSKYPVKIMFNL